MICTDAKEHLNEVNENAQKFVKSSVSYYKLKVFKLLMMSVTSMSRVIIMGFTLLIALIFLSLAASIGIGALVDNMFIGYLSVGLFYVIVAYIFYLKRSAFERRIIKKFSKSFFD